MKITRVGVYKIDGQGNKVYLPTVPRVADGRYDLSFDHPAVIHGSYCAPDDGTPIEGIDFCRPAHVSPGEVLHMFYELRGVLC